MEVIYANSRVEHFISGGRPSSTLFFHCRFSGTHTLRRNIHQLGPQSGDKDLTPSPAPSLPTCLGQLLLVRIFLKLFIYYYLAVLGLHCCVWAFPICGERGLLSSPSAWASHCSGFSCCGSRALEHRLGSCGVFLDQRSNPRPPALAGRFLTAGPQRKSQK